MITLKEELVCNSISIYDDFIDFPDQFLNYISIFRITACIDFEIQLKDEFIHSEKIEREINSYIKSKYSELTVIFTKSQLPF